MYWTLKMKCILLSFSHFSAEAVFARCLSAMQGERIEASKQIKGPATTKYTGDKKEFINDIKYVSYCVVKTIFNRGHYDFWCVHWNISWVKDFVEGRDYHDLEVTFTIQ